MSQEERPAGEGQEQELRRAPLGAARPGQKFKVPETPEQELTDKEKKKAAKEAAKKERKEAKAAALEKELGLGEDGQPAHRRNLFSLPMWIFSLLAVLSVSAFPVLFLYFQNAAEVYFYTIVGLVLLFLALGAGVFVVALLFTRDPAKAAVIAVLFMLAFENYHYIEVAVQMVFPAMGYIYLLPIGFVIFLHLAWLLAKKMSPKTASNLSKVLCIVFCGLLLVNLVLAVPSLSAKMSVKDEGQNTQQTAVAAGSYPNVYFFLFDEFSSFDVIEKYFGYDNSEFENFLLESGFAVSDTSYNESLRTDINTANLVSMDYPATPDDPEAKWDQLRADGPLLGYPASAGYSFSGVGMSDYFGVESETRGPSAQAVTMDATPFSTLVLEKTALDPFVAKGTAAMWTEHIETAVEYFHSAGAYRAGGNHFTLSYIYLPHQPFIFEADGSYTNEAYWDDWSVPDYYLGQYIYISRQITDMVAQIIKNDPGAVIILQSDHGPRRLEGPVEVPMEEKARILNAVYFGGQQGPDIEGLSAVNTLRTVYSWMYGLDLPPVEMPNYYAQTELAAEDL